MLKARKLSEEEIKANDDLYKGCVMLEPREWMDWAIQRKVPTTGAIEYNYDRLVLAFMEMNKWDENSAETWVDYNVDVKPASPRYPVVYHEPVDYEDE
jgi:hypothetical protein